MRSNMTMIWESNFTWSDKESIPIQFIYLFYYYSFDPCIRFGLTSDTKYSGSPSSTDKPSGSDEQG